MSVILFIFTHLSENICLWRSFLLWHLQHIDDFQKQISNGIRSICFIILRKDTLIHFTWKWRQSQQESYRKILKKKKKRKIIKQSYLNYPHYLSVDSSPSWSYKAQRPFHLYIPDFFWLELTLGDCHSSCSWRWSSSTSFAEASPSHLEFLDLGFISLL